MEKKNVFQEPRQRHLKINMYALLDFSIIPSFSVQYNVDKGYFISTGDYMERENAGEIIWESVLI